MRSQKGYKGRILIPRKVEVNSYMLPCIEKYLRSGSYRKGISAIPQFMQCGLEIHVDYVLAVRFQCKLSRILGALSGRLCLYRFRKVPSILKVF